MPGQSSPATPFTLRQLRAFVTVANTGSFSAAARHLQKAQSAVSSAIADLEIDLDTTLFERVGREPVLTEAGQRLLTEAQAVLMRCRSLEEHANEFSNHTETELTLALDNAVPMASIAPKLGDWETCYPTVTLRVIHPNMHEVPQLLMRNRVDLALMLVQRDYPKDVGFSRLGQLRMVEVAHTQHPLTQKNGISYAELSNYRQLIFAPHGYAIATSEYVISPRYYVAEGYLSLLEMLRHNLGWAMVPLSIVAEDVRSDQLRIINLAAYPFTDWIVGVDLLWSRTRQSGRAANDLKQRLIATEINDSKTSVF